jgi:hypothetical protein
MHDRLVEAHARLSTLKMDLPEADAVEGKHIREFHDILQVLEHASGCDLGSYRVPAADLAPQNGGAGGANGSGANSEGSGEPACDRSALMSRIDGVLTFFGVKATPGHLNG